MKIIKVKIQNFRSIENAEFELDDFNVIVGQNNHGKTNFFDSINWFFNGYDRNVKKEDLIFSDVQNGEISVEIIFNGLQEAIENLRNSTKKIALETIFNSEDEITIRRTTEFDDGKKRQLLNPQNKIRWVIFVAYVRKGFINILISLIFVLKI